MISMKNTTFVPPVLLATAFALTACAGPASEPAITTTTTTTVGTAQAPSSVVAVPSRTTALQVHVRGTLESVDAQTLVVKDRTGRSVRLVRPAALSISEVYPIGLNDIAQGSFVGTSAETRADGTLQALEVHVFPENARGLGEGHYPWDLQQGATMTNATVSTLAPAPAAVQGGKQLRLNYAGGEKTVLVPAGVPVFTWKPGDAGLLLPGKKVFVIAQDKDGQPTAVNVLVGRDGYMPPM